MTAATAHIVPGASFTEDRLELRRKTLGASEVPAVLGLDRYRSPLHIWLEKKGKAPAFEGNEFTEWGLRVEPAIRQKVAEVLHVSIEQPGTLIHPSAPWMSATPDGLFEYESRPTVLEMKNKTDRQSIHWGVAGTDEVPFDVAAQTYWQMEVTGVAHAVVAVLFGKADFRLYFLHRDPDVATSIVARCAAFWQAHVVGDLEPEVTGGEAVAEYLKRKFAVHGDALRTATREEESLIAQLRTVRDKIKEHEATKELLENKLMSAIGADAGIQGRGGRITWKAPSGLDTAWKQVALALNAPQSLIDEHSHPKSRRFLATFPREG